MQNKAAIIVLAIALGLVSIYQLSFTVATYKVKKRSKSLCKWKPGKRNSIPRFNLRLTKRKMEFSLETHLKSVREKELEPRLSTLKAG